MVVVKWYTQMYGVNYCDRLSPIARLDTTRLLLIITTQIDCKVFQIDVKSSFLKGILEKDIYIEQPSRFMKHGDEDQVYLLKTGLFGLKKAPRSLYSRIDDHLLSLGFGKSLSSSSLYCM